MRKSHGRTQSSSRCMRLYLLYAPLNQEFSEREDPLSAGSSWRHGVSHSPLNLRGRERSDFPLRT